MCSRPSTHSKPLLRLCPEASVLESSPSSETHGTGWTSLSSSWRNNNNNNNDNNDNNDNDDNSFELYSTFQGHKVAYRVR